MTRVKIREVHYGWVIVAAVFLIMGAAWGIVYNASSLFIDPISREFGFSRSEINATMTIRAMCQVVVSLVAGKIFKHFHLKKVMRISAIVLIVSFYMYSQAKALWMFYVIALVSSIAITLIAIVPLSIIISNWFSQKKGMALGIAFMGSGVGGMIFNSLTGIWIKAYGWRTAYQILAGLMAVIIIPCIFIVLKAHPREMGLQPYGVSRESAASFVSSENEGITLATAMKSKRFWVLNLASIFIYTAISSLISNVAPHLTNVGYSITYSANVVALIMGSLAIGKVVLGKLFDSIGIKGTTMVATFSGLVALIGLMFPTFTPSLFVVILFGGIGSAYVTIANSVLTVEMFGKKDYNAILGFLSAIAAIGSIISPMITGVLYDASGSYYSSFGFFIGVCALAIFLYWGVFASTSPSSKRQND